MVGEFAFLAFLAGLPLGLPDGLLGVGHVEGFHSVHCRQGLGDLSRFRIKLPESFVLEVTFINPTDAYRKAWYPGARQSGPQTVRFESKDYFEVLRAIRFIM